MLLKITIVFILIALIAILAYIISRHNDGGAMPSKKVKHKLPPEPAKTRTNNYLHNPEANEPIAKATADSLPENLKNQAPLAEKPTDQNLEQSAAKAVDKKDVLASSTAPVTTLENTPKDLQPEKPATKAIDEPKVDKSKTAEGKQTDTAHKAIVSDGDTAKTDTRYQPSLSKATFKPIKTNTAAKPEAPITIDNSANTLAETKAKPVTEAETKTDVEQPKTDAEQPIVVASKRVDKTEATLDDIEAKPEPTSKLDVKTESKVDDVSRSESKTHTITIKPVAAPEISEDTQVTSNRYIVDDEESQKSLLKTDSALTDTASTASRESDNAAANDLVSSQPAVTDSQVNETAGQINSQDAKQLNDDTTSESESMPAFDFVKQIDNAQLTLDLAHQYLEVGEYDSAKRLVREVILSDDATIAQKQNAQDVLDRLY